MRNDFFLPHPVPILSSMDFKLHRVGMPWGNMPEMVFGQARNASLRRSLGKTRLAIAPRYKSLPRDAVQLLEISIKLLRETGSRFPDRKT